MNHPAEPEVWVVIQMNDKAHPTWGVDEDGPLVHEQYIRTATRENAVKRAASLERANGSACRIARLVFE